jgi:mannose-6-phosphate isomerase-like protein (cupin superfamily)
MLEIIPIEGIQSENHALALQEGVIDARIHNLRIGQVIALHSHPQRPELVAIVRGTARVRGVRISEETGEPILRDEIVEAGNLVFSPPTAVHAFSNVGVEPLWCLVMVSPPFAENNYLGLASTESTLDFLVLPIDSHEPARGSYRPDWAKKLALRRSGELNHFPNVPGELLRKRDPIEVKSSDLESWLILLQGSGVLSHSEGEVAVRSPALIRGLGSNWSIRDDGAGQELVVLRFRLPAN